MDPWPPVPSVDPVARYPAGVVPAASYPTDPTLIGGFTAQAGGVRRIVGDAWLEPDPASVRAVGRVGAAGGRDLLRRLGVWGWPDADTGGRAGHPPAPGS